MVASEVNLKDFLLHSGVVLFPSCPHDLPRQQWSLQAPGSAGFLGSIYIQAENTFARLSNNSSYKVDWWFDCCAFCALGSRRSLAVEDRVAAVQRDGQCSSARRP